MCSHHSWYTLSLPLFCFELASLPTSIFVPDNHKSRVLVVKFLLKPNFSFPLEVAEGWAHAAWGRDGYLDDCVIHLYLKPIHFFSLHLTPHHSGCITKYHRLGDLYINSGDVMLIVLESGYQHSWIPVRALFQVGGCRLLIASSHGRRGAGAV